MIILSTFLSGCIGPTEYLSKEQIKVTIKDNGAWLNYMPGASREKHISITITLENAAGFDLYNLHIKEAEVIKENEVVGSFIPVFQISKDCSEKLDGEKRLDDLDLNKDCILNFSIRSWRDSDNLEDFEGIIKVRFRFENEEYYTDTYETEEMTINEVE